MVTNDHTVDSNILYKNINLCLNSQNQIKDSTNFQKRPKNRIFKKNHEEFILNKFQYFEL